MVNHWRIDLFYLLCIDADLKLGGYMYGVTVRQLTETENCLAPAWISVIPEKFSYKMGVKQDLLIIRAWLSLESEYCSSKWGTCPECQVYFVYLNPTWSPEQRYSWKRVGDNVFVPAICIDFMKKYPIFSFRGGGSCPFSLSIIRPCVRPLEYTHWNEFAFTV